MSKIVGCISDAWDCVLIDCGFRLNSDFDDNEDPSERILDFESDKRCDVEAPQEAQQEPTRGNTLEIEARRPGSSYIYEHDPNNYGGMINPGTVLMENAPFAYVLSNEQSKYICATCFKPLGQTERTVCSCQRAQYCNEKCQSQGWADGHKYECKNLKNGSSTYLTENNLSDTARLVLRVMARIQDKTAEEVKDLVGPGKYRRFQDLMSHSSQLRADRRHERSLKHTYAEVQDLCAGNSALKVPNFEDFVTILGRVMVNSFGIHDEEYVSIGSGIYLGASIYDHSCRPTAIVSFENTRITVRNLVEIPANLPLSQITVEYLDLMTPKAWRQEKLRDNYFFECKCERCHADPGDDLDLVKCPFCPYELSLTAQKKCPWCSKKVPKKYRKKIRKIERKVGKYLRTNTDPSSTEVVEGHYARLISRRFAYSHSLVLLAARTIFQNHFSVANNDKALYYGRIYVEGMRRAVRPNHGVLGLCLLRLSQICSYAGLSIEAGKYTREGVRILGIAQGVDSDHYKTIVGRLERCQLRAMGYNNRKVQDA